MGENGQEGGAADRLIESLSEFVKQQNGKPAEKESTEPPPGWKDAAWMAVLIADATLIYTWIPEDAKGPIEFLDKFLPWLLGGLWAVANVWFRDRLLAYSRLVWVRRMELAFLVCGVAVGVKMFPIMPVSAPEHTPLMIGGKPVASGERFWLRLAGDHNVELDAGPQDVNEPLPNQKPRTIELAWWRIPGAVFDKRLTEWHRIYWAYIRAPAPSRIRVTIKDSNGKFDDDFLEPLTLQKSEVQTQLDRVAPTDKDYKRALEFDHRDERKTETIALPSGTYIIRMAGCVPEVDSLSVGPGQHGTRTLGPCQKEQE